MITRTIGTKQGLRRTYVRRGFEIDVAIPADIIGNIMHWMISHLRRSLIVMFNLLFNYRLIFKLVGFINQRFQIIESVFLAYPANNDYALAYVYRNRLPKVRWTPWPVGCLVQNGKLALMFVISANNADFREPGNIENLRSVAAQMEQFRVMLGAKRKTFAGILPGILYFKRIIREKTEAETTVKAVMCAIAKTQERHFLHSNDHIVVLGGKGFIGRMVVAALQAPHVHVIDKDLESEERMNILDHLRGEKTLLVNIADNGALNEYLPHLWSEVTILNEVYPEPTKDMVKVMQQKKCTCYHIVGVRAKAIPAFPHAYEGAIPCCAAWQSRDMHVELLKLC